MPVLHRGLETERGIITSHLQPATTRLAKAEQSSIKKAILARYEEGDKIADPVTGEVAVVDGSTPLGLRLLFKSVNPASHGPSVKIDIGDLRRGAKPTPIVKARQVEKGYHQPGDSRSAEGMAKAREAIAKGDPRNRI